MKKFIISLVLVFLVLTSTTVVYANISENDDVYLDSPSDFYLANETLQTEQGKTIIPLSQVRGVNDVHYVEYQYEVIVKDGFDLYATIEELAFSQHNLDSDTLNDLFNFDISYETLSNGSYQDSILSQSEDVNTVMVTVTISMNEPSTEELFYQVVGGSLSFEVYFFVN